MRKKCVLAVVALLIFSVTGAWAHDPRTTAKDFQHTMVIQGAGKMQVQYKSMHWNQPSYERAKANDQFRTRINQSVWNALGKATLDFDVVIGETMVKKGAYGFGINIDAHDQFSIVLKDGTNSLMIPMKTAADASMQNYLTFSIYPSDKVDEFVIEGRCGKFLATQVVKVPYLSPHEHQETPKPATPPIPKKN